MTYTQLTQEQRYQISALLKTAQSQTKVAEVIGVHRSTVCREIKRNRGRRGKHRRREGVLRALPFDFQAGETAPADNNPMKAGAFPRAGDC